MAPQSQDTQHVVQISTNNTRRCEHCAELVGGENLASSVNHYIEAHGYRLLHIGTETIHGLNGEPWHTTVAFLGRKKSDAPRPRNLDTFPPFPRL